MSEFEDFERRAWERDYASEFVGFGTIEVSVVRPRDRTHHLRFRLKGKRVTREEARRHFEKHILENRLMRAKFRAVAPSQRQDLEKEAERLCEAFNDPNEEGSSWPFSSESERAGWRRVAMAAYGIPDQKQQQDEV